MSHLNPLLLLFLLTFLIARIITPPGPTTSFIILVVGYFAIAVPAYFLGVRKGRQQPPLVTRL